MLSEASKQKSFAKVPTKHDVLTPCPKMDGKLWHYLITVEGVGVHKG